MSEGSMPTPHPEKRGGPSGEMRRPRRRRPAPRGPGGNEASTRETSPRPHREGGRPPQPGRSTRQAGHLPPRRPGPYGSGTESQPSHPAPAASAPAVTGPGTSSGSGPERDSRPRNEQRPAKRQNRAPKTLDDMRRECDQLEKEIHLEIEAIRHIALDF